MFGEVSVFQGGPGSADFIAYRTWDRRKKKALGRFAGLRFFGRTNVRHAWNLASRHWPHHLCWSWCLWVYVGLHRPHFQVMKHGNGGQVYLALGFCQFVYSRQDYDYMPAIGWEPEAPAIRLGNGHIVGGLHGLTPDEIKLCKVMRG